MLLYINHRTSVCEDIQYLRNSNTYIFTEAEAKHCLHNSPPKKPQKTCFHSDSHTAAEIVLLQKLKGGGGNTWKLKAGLSGFFFSP